MIKVQNVLVSEEIVSGHFCCDVSKCLGACCVEGDAGAPLEEDEIHIIQDDLEFFRKYMTGEGVAEVEKNGVFDFDQDGKYVTPLVNGMACAFAYFEDNIAKCAIEKAFEKGETTFQKPISCHLYPIRVSKLSENLALNYHRWNVCKPAIKRGRSLNLSIVSFCKESLIRQFGKAWYEALITKVGEKNN